LAPPLPIEATGFERKSFRGRELGEGAATLVGERPEPLVLDEPPSLYGIDRGKPHDFLIAANIRLLRIRAVLEIGRGNDGRETL
jgi:hypothetical protein